MKLSAMVTGGKSSFTLSDESDVLEIKTNKQINSNPLRKIK